MSLEPQEAGSIRPLRGLGAEAVYWVITALVGLFALGMAAGWLPMSHDVVQDAQRDWTLPFYTLAALWMAVSGALVLRESLPGWLDWRRHVPVMVAVVVGGSWLLVHEPIGWRVFFDEPGHAGVAHAMYEQGSVESANSFHLCANGEWVTRYHPSQRLGLYPYLGNLIHGVCGGSHPAHLLWLNGFLGFAFLACGAALGQLLAGRAGALWLVALLTFLPLTAQLAASGSYDLLFGFLLILALGQTVAYVEKPTRARFSFLFSLGAALTLSRYEGALFLGLIGLLLWCRDGRFFRPGWNLALSALMLIPTSMTIWVFLQMSKLAYLVEGTFGLGNIPGNLADTLKHLFIPLPGVSNLAPIGWSALGALAVFFWALGRRREKLFSWPVMACLAWILAILLQNLVVVAASFWSTPDDPTTARLMLPVWVAATVAGGWFLGRLSPRFQPWLCAAFALWLLLFQMPSWSRHEATRSFLPPRAFGAYEDFARRMPQRSLFLSESPVTLGIHGFAAGGADEFNEGHAKTAGVVAAGHYDRVFALMLGVWTSNPKTGDLVFAYQKRGKLSAEFWALEIKERHSLAGSGNEAHIYEVTGWKDGEGRVHPMSEIPPGAVPPPHLSPGEVMAWQLDF